MSRAGRFALTVDLCCILYAGTAIADETSFIPWTSFAESFPDFPVLSTLDLQFAASGVGGIPVVEISSLHRPAGIIDLLAETTPSGSLAGVLVGSGTEGADGATISVMTLSTPGGENATTVFAVTQTDGGPILAAATTRWDGGLEGGGTSAYAVMAGPEGAVFRATGDLSQMQLQPWTASRRREAIRKPAYGWDVRGTGRTDVSVFLRTVNGLVSDQEEGGIDVDLAETVSGSRLPSILMGQRHTLLASASGMQAGIGLSRDLTGGLSLWTQVGVGLSRVQAESRLVNFASVDDAAAMGVAGIGTLRRIVPSTVMSIGVSQSYGNGHSVSVYVAGEAELSPVLAFAGDGPAKISFEARRGLTVGLTMNWRF